MAGTQAVMRDWESRELVEIVQMNVLSMVSFLNKFDVTVRGKLSLLNEKLAKLERSIDLCEAGAKVALAPLKQEEKQEEQEEEQEEEEEEEAAAAADGDDDVDGEAGGGWGSGGGGEEGVNGERGGGMAELGEGRGGDAGDPGWRQRDRCVTACNFFVIS